MYDSFQENAELKCLYNEKNDWWWLGYGWQCVVVDGDSG